MLVLGTVGTWLVALAVVFWWPTAIQPIFQYHVWIYRVLNSLLAIALLAIICTVGRWFLGPVREERRWGTRAWLLALLSPLYSRAFFFHWWLAQVLLASGNLRPGSPLPGYPPGMEDIFLGSILLGVFPAVMGLHMDDQPRRAQAFLAASPILFFASAIATPMFRNARGRADTRACYANQKTIAGAVEMYNLDKTTRRTDVDTPFLQELVKGGYLQGVPTDPGPYVPIKNTYRYDAGTKDITCTVHGSIK
jgi:hypothetical protein